MRHSARLQRSYDIDEKPSFSKDTLLRIWGYFKPYQWRLLLSTVVIFLTSALALTPPLFLQKIIDQALPNKNSRLLVYYVALSLGAYIVLNLLQVGQATVNMNISRNIIYDMKNQMYHHLQHMSQRFFSSEKQGEINTRISSDIDGVSIVFNATFVSLLSSLFTLGTTLFALFSLHWKLALIALLTVPLYVFPTRKVAQLRWEITKNRQEALSKLNQHTQETLSISGSTLMKVFTTELQEYETFDTINQEVTQLQKREEITGRWFRMSMNLLTAVGPLLVYLFGGFLFIRGELSLGVILMFATMLDRLYRPVMQLLNLHMDTVRSFALFQRIFEYLDMPHEIENTSQIPLSVSKGCIEFQNVSFAYTSEEPTLTDISFTAPSGQVTALVGPSGAGKTTITNLIPRLYNAQQGVIAIDQQDITEVSLESLRGSIGIVTQEPYLFNGTIRENMLYGAPQGTTEDQLYRAAATAYIHDFIQSLPKGYDTLVGNRGIKLSGGEKQRISIARVLLKDPQILILDEATSSLDSLSERHVQKAIERLMSHRTSLVIAHRLSTIQNADQILVLEDGQIVERGTHQQLLERSGTYATLYQKQYSEPLQTSSSQTVCTA